jgi:apolipoprotein N-acyltransferase
MAPSICFESTVPQLIRGHVLELSRKQQPADVLLNVTNDGWFWGSAILDLHFRCAIFRAVENRKPMLVAANTGVSGWIDGNGLARERGERRRAEVLIAKVAPDGRWSPYLLVGDWPATLCALFCLVLAGRGRFQSASASRESPQSAQLA